MSQNSPVQRRATEMWEAAGTIAAELMRLPEAERHQRLEELRARGPQVLSLVRQRLDAAREVARGSNLGATAAQVARHVMVMPPDQRAPYLARVNRANPTLHTLVLEEFARLTREDHRARAEEAGAQLAAAVRPITDRWSEPDDTRLISETDLRAAIMPEPMTAEQTRELREMLARHRPGRGEALPFPAQVEVRVSRPMTAAEMDQRFPYVRNRDARLALSLVPLAPENREPYLDMAASLDPGSADRARRVLMAFRHNPNLFAISRYPADEGRLWDYIDSAFAAPTTAGVTPDGEPVVATEDQLREYTDGLRGLSWGEIERRTEWDVAPALRERARELIGLPPRRIEILGFADAGFQDPDPDPVAADRTIDSVLRSAIGAFVNVLRERRGQRARTGDWVAVTSTGTFDKVTDPAKQRPGSYMPAGRPMTHVGQVIGIEIVTDPLTGLANERVTIALGGGTRTGQRVMPGATDNTLMLPCCAAGCRHPHLNAHPFCRVHQTGNSATEHTVALVERRLADLRLAHSREGEEAVKAALAADIDVFGQYVADQRHALAARVAAEERARRRQEEQRRREAVEAEARERAELQRLMAKHGVIGRVPDPNAPALPPEGERNLEL